MDGFSIFPFAIVLSLALGEAFKQTVKEVKATGDFISWDHLYALVSFLCLILPFYQGMNRYIFLTYGSHAQQTKPQSIFLIIDGAAFLLESALFFVMSRNLSVERWRHFYWSVFVLLIVDSLWGLTVSWHADPSAMALIFTWTILNFGAGILLLLLLLFAKNCTIKWIPAQIGMGLMIARSVFDYSEAWDFYFR